MAADDPSVEWTIRLPKRLADYVEAQVDPERGVVPSTIIQEALDVLRLQDEANRIRDEELRTAVAVGLRDLEEGRVTRYSADDPDAFVEGIKAAGQARRHAMHRAKSA